MREIKFRAIIKTPDGKIDKYPCGVFNNKIMISTTIPYYGYAYVTLTEEYGKLIGLQQYTGIKDINGNEIYEGDILKDTNNAIYYVDFIRGCFYLKTNYKSFPHLGWTEWLPMCEIDRLAIPVEFEIIGNIYENPELLD